jgi:hypothetical protein
LHIQWAVGNHSIGVVRPIAPDDRRLIEGIEPPVDTLSKGFRDQICLNGRGATTGDDPKRGLVCQ